MDAEFHRDGRVVPKAYVSNLRWHTGTFVNCLSLRLEIRNKHTATDVGSSHAESDVGSGLDYRVKRDDLLF